jgi:4a-hydroxytetrahydrobiopterin dehydratase
MATLQASSLLSEEKVRECAKALKDWKVVPGGKSLAALYVMKDFVSAVALIGKIAEAAEAMDHHPDLRLSAYRRLELELSTHSAGGLTEKDFTLAAIIERLPKTLKA